MDFPTNLNNRFHLFGLPTAQDGPRGSQDRPKTAHEALQQPKTAQGGPKTALPRHTSGAKNIQGSARQEGDTRLQRGPGPPPGHTFGPNQEVVRQ